jgi:hypothetical protein
LGLQEEVMRAVVREDVGRMPTHLIAHACPRTSRAWEDIFLPPRSALQSARACARWRHDHSSGSGKQSGARGLMASQAGRRRLEKFTRVPQISLRNRATSIAA